MLEVLKEIDKLKTLLEEKNDATETLNKQLSRQKLDLEKLESRVSAKLNHASAMERVYKKYEDFDNEVADFNKKKINYSSKMQTIEKKEKEVNKAQQDLDKQEEDVSKKSADLSRKVLALKEREANFDKKKDDLKAMISGQAIKDLLK